MADKKYYKCKICGDIHYGREAPELCPTCKQVKAYLLTTKDEAKKTMDF